jgi:hypothetical protein
MTPSPTPPSDRDLERGLIRVLETTQSEDTFCLAVQTLLSLSDKGRQAIPAALGCADRLGISKGMREIGAAWTHTQRLLAALVQPDLNHLHAALRRTIEVQCDLCIAEVTGEELPGLAALLEGGGRTQPDGGAWGFAAEPEQVFLRLEELRSRGRAKIMAKPCLVTLSGRPASFLSGGRIPVHGPEGPNAIRFEEIGTQVQLLPIVLDDGRIRLDIEPSVATVNGLGTASNPGIDIRRSHTTLVMSPGRTFLMTWPGAAFSAPSADRKESGPGLLRSAFIGEKLPREPVRGLVILVTPHIHSPAD